MPTITTFKSLSNPVFRIYIIGMIGQWSSMNMQIMVRSLLIYRISGSGVILGLASLANAVPMIIFSLWGGAIADRMQKKTILFLCMLGFMVTSLMVTLSLVFGWMSTDKPDSWWILIASGALQGTVMGIIMPARQSIITEIVEPDHLMNAISLNMMGMNVFRILAPAATGFLVDGFGFTSIYLIATVMYGFGAACMLFLPKTTPQTSQGESTIGDIIDGFRYLRREPVMRDVIIFSLIGMICGMPFIQLMPMITDDVLKVGASGMGILMTLSGIGAVIGSIVTATGINHRRGLVMLLGGGLMAASLIGFGFSDTWWLSIVLVIFIGLGQTGYRAVGNTLVQYYCEPLYRGRVMSFMMMGIGFSSLGTFFAGLLAEGVNVQWAIGGFAMFFAAATIITLLARPKVRNLD